MHLLAGKPPEPAEQPPKFLFQEVAGKIYLISVGIKNCWQVYYTKLDEKFDWMPGPNTERARSSLLPSIIR